MILHSVVFRHPVLHGHIEVWHPTKELADGHVRRLGRQKVGYITNNPVEVPTSEGREALCDWLNKRHVFPEDEFAGLTHKEEINERPKEEV